MSPVDLIENAWADLETVFSTTFSVCAVAFAIAELVIPSHKCSQTKCSNGVSSLTKILNSNGFSNSKAYCAPLKWPTPTYEKNGEYAYY